MTVKEVLVYTVNCDAVVGAALSLSVAQTTLSDMVDDYIDENVYDEKCKSAMKVLSKCGIAIGTGVIAYNTGKAIGTIATKILNI